MAPTVKLGQPSTEQIQQNPREAALYYQLLEKDSITSQVNIREMMLANLSRKLCFNMHAYLVMPVAWWQC